MPDLTPRRRPPDAAIYYPTPLPAPPTGGALQPHQGAPPAVQRVMLPDGRIVTGYALTPATPPLPPAPERARVSPVAVNIALGGVGFAAVCGGLLLLTGFIAALAALIHQLIILAAVVFGLYIAAVVLGSGGGGGTTVNIRKAVFKRCTFRG